MGSSFDLTCRVLLRPASGKSANGAYAVPVLFTSTESIYTTRLNFSPSPSFWYLPRHSVELQGRRLHIQAQRPIQRFSSHWESLFDPQALEPAFSRTFVLEPWVDLERVSATLKKSFLEVKLPRKPVPKHSTPRRIVIVSGGNPKEEEAVPATRSMQTVQVQPPTDPRSASKSHPQEGPADTIMLDVKRTIKHAKEQTSEKKIIDIADAQTAAKLNKGKGPATEEQLATWEEERRLAERLRRQDEEDGSVEDCEF
jgi:hypothetical protein